MPELAEVEYYRRKWNAGIGRVVRSVHLHATKRIFRGVDTEQMQRALSGARHVSSAAPGKQMLFRFSPAAGLGSGTSAM